MRWSARGSIICIADWDKAVVISMRKSMELIAPCHFGLEAVVKKEICALGYDVSRVEDGRVTFIGDAEAVCRANIFLRSAERVLLKVGSFRAETFDELFEETKRLPLEDYLPRDARFYVAKAASVKSRLFSPSDIQSIMKKAMVERLKPVYGLERFPEDGKSFPFRVFFLKDEVTVGLDTTGDSLHKRGYRRLAAPAPIAENLAASLLMLTPWRVDRTLVDPFCGSGTFPIEAALMAARIAPGVNREFTACGWAHLFPAKAWTRARDEALDGENIEAAKKEADIQGYDIDESMVEIARENARMAGVEELIHFQKRDVAELSHAKKYGFLITNPPYGERLAGENLSALYRTLGERFSLLDAWSMYIISAYEHTERDVGRKAARNRKIYNGMLKTYFYQFPGPKPPRGAGRHGTGHGIPEGEDGKDA